MGLVPIVGTMLATQALQNKIRKGMEKTFPAMGKAFAGIKQDAPVISPQEKQRLSNQELLEKLQQQMYIDQARLEGSNYPTYRGNTVAPMSAMTQNARQMREDFSKKPSPYSKKVSEVMKRPNEGFSEEQIQNMIRSLGRGGASERMATDRLHKSLDNTYGYEPERERRFVGKIGKDASRAMNLGEKNIRSLSDELKGVEDRRGMNIAAALSKAGTNKAARREGLINQLEEFGNQEHALENLKARAARDSFDEEQMAPYRKLALAKEALGGIDVESMHPDVVSTENERLQRIANVYNLPHVNYPGQRVIDTQPETQTAFNLANQINPKYKDVFYDDRKALERDFVGGDNLATKTYDKLPEALNPLMEHLDYLTKKQLKDINNQVGGKHVRLGTYGSGVHKAQTEKAMRELLQKVQSEREGALLGGVKTQAGILGNQEQNNLNKYNLMGELGNKEFGDILRSNAELAKLGWTKRGNKQQEENEALRNWYGQLNHEWPMAERRFRNSGLEGGRAVGFNREVAPEYDTNLDNLFKQHQLYSENNRAMNSYKEDMDKKVTDLDSYYQTRQNEQVAEVKRRADQEALERSRRLETERQLALRRAAQMAPMEQKAVPQNAGPWAARHDRERNAAWGLFDLSRKLGLGQATPPAWLPPTSNIAVGGHAANVASMMGQPNYQPITREMFDQQWKPNNINWAISQDLQKYFV